MSTNEEKSVFTEFQSQIATGENVAGSKQEEAFMQRMAPHVQNMARRRLTTAVRKIFDSNDITSTVMRRLVGTVRKGQLNLSTEGEFMSMLDVMTQRAVIEKHQYLHALLRDQSRNQSADASDDDSGSWDLMDGDDRRPHLTGNTTSSPVDAVILAERLEALNGLLDAIRARLAPDDWYLFRRRLIDEAPWSVIAEEMGVTEDAARMRLARILVKLRDDLSDFGGGNAAL